MRLKPKHSLKQNLKWLSAQFNDECIESKTIAILATNLGWSAETVILVANGEKVLGQLDYTYCSIGIELVAKNGLQFLEELHLEPVRTE
ncbi:MAG: hypothetical protein KDC92_01235 [Bacteroidetes bacterium]|nr:hypothetical protein [Bacteroidota bacterium]